LPLSSDPPVLLIVAGPNGSGKSSAYQDTDIQDLGRSFWIINPDLLAKRIHEVEGKEPTEANREAVVRIEAWLEASIFAHQTIGVETVLSTPKYQRLVVKAKELGFEIFLIYVVLDTVERNIERVRIRVKKGGHDVPEDKLRARFSRSLDQLPWFLEQADRAWIWDNSGAGPKTMAEKRDGTIIVHEGILPFVLEAIKKISSD
jgi:predicted ABC-type ATPase